MIATKRPLPAVRVEGTLTLISDKFPFVVNGTTTDGFYNIIELLRWFDKKRVSITIRDLDATENILYELSNEHQWIDEPDESVGC